MKFSTITAVIAGLLICLPCLLPILIAAGVLASAFGAIGAGLSQVWLTLALGAGFMLLMLTAAVVVVARRSARSCDTETAFRAGDHGSEAAPTN
jgi:uncharacterized membrane protein YedE/YeeE